MRRLLATYAAVVMVAATLSAQTPTVSLGFDQILVQHEGEGGDGTNHILNVIGTESYLGEPAATVRANALPGGTLRASRFTLRSWQEGGNARIVISAVVTDSQTPTREVETVIATYRLEPYGAVRVSEMSEWGAAPMILRVIRPIR